MKKLVLETTAPFQGLPELVADREGLFEKEGLQIEWVERESDDKSTHVNVNTPKGLNPFSSHGKMLEQGKADMYNACEWGNYCRVQDTQVGSRQVGRRGIVTYAAIVVRRDSQVFTGQQLAGKTVGVPFYFGTHYLALHLLEGFMPREDIKLCRTSNGSRQRFDAMRQLAPDAHRDARIDASEHAQKSVRIALCAGGKLQRKPVGQEGAVVRGQRGQRPPDPRTQLRGTEFARARALLHESCKSALRMAQLHAHRAR